MNALANRPAYLGQADNLNSKLGGGLSTSQPPRISLADDRFTLIDENGARHAKIAPALTLDVVIVGANPNVSRTYYEGGYDRDDAQPPACYSDNGIGPSEGSLKPQHATCAGCPQAEWGKINAMGNTVPWCSTRKKIAVVVAGAGDTVYQLGIPPKSLKASWQPYVNSLNDQGAGAQEVVTHLKIEDKVLKFEATGWVPQETIEFVRGVVEGDMPDNVVNAFDKVKQNVPAVARTTHAVIDRPDSHADVAIISGAQAAAGFGKPMIAAQAETVQAPKMTAAQAETVQAPKRGRPRARANETVIGPGPIAPETPFPKAEVPFGRPGWQETLNAIDPDREVVNGFGMQSAETPTPDMKARLDKVFGKFGG